MSRHANRIRDFGPSLYRLRRQELDADHHVLVEHQELLDALRACVRDGEKEVRMRAVQALRYAQTRSEGLVDWRFDVTGVERKALVTWAADRVRAYFAKV